MILVENEKFIIYGHKGEMNSYPPCGIASIYIIILKLNYFLNLFNIFRSCFLK